MIDDKIIDDLKSQFDIYQQQAINHFIGPCLLIAPAGSGKTSVLIQRIISLVQKDVPPENILALTFSKKAQEEMVQRLQPLLKENYSKVNVLTYHSLCHKYEGIGKKLITYSEQQNILDSLKIALSLDENINANSISKICSNKLKG
ncbi:MAG TPA: UvrD-helicase domain-containing protein, partial [Clostridia bacterium]|nr:UvrD-helicase domain-containing protein [Clostridia bacterium]